MAKSASDVRHDLTPHQKRIIADRIERHLKRNPKQSKFDSEPRKANLYQLARLAQKVNSQRNSGYSGSRKEKEHCESWNIKPVNDQRVV